MYELELFFFEDRGYVANLDIDAEIYLAAFLVWWFNGRVFVDASASIRPKTFLMAIEMARGKQSNLIVLYLSWAY